MLFQRKIERAQKWLRERNGIPESGQKTHREGELPSMEELREEGRNQIQLEKSDLPAMIIAALITILPVCILVLLAICSVVFLL